MRTGTRPVVLISAGIGVTPVLSMLYALANGKADSHREVWWIYGTRNGEEHVFASEARKLLNAIPGSHSAIAYSNPDPAEQFGKDYDIQGHINLAV